MNNNHHWTDEAEARSEIKELVGEYYRQFKKPMTEKVFQPGDRISYASRVYDEKEMQSLTDASLLLSSSFVSRQVKDLRRRMKTSQQRLLLR